MGRTPRRTAADESELVVKLRKGDSSWRRKQGVREETNCRDEMTEESGFGATSGGPGHQGDSLGTRFHSAHSKPRKIRGRLPNQWPRFFAAGQILRDQVASSVASARRMAWSRTSAGHSAINATKRCRSPAKSARVASSKPGKSPAIDDMK